MKLKIGINGFGRVGRLLLRAWAENGMLDRDDFEIWFQKNAKKLGSETTSRFSNAKLSKEFGAKISKSEIY